MMSSYYLIKLNQYLDFNFLYNLAVNSLPNIFVGDPFSHFHQLLNAALTLKNLKRIPL
jgi:hypothetical protein